MSDQAAFDFGKFIPGFDFLQNLAQGARQVQAGPRPLTGWVAPTLSVEEIDKRISELKTVQYWLEQNTHAVKATVQALEVQKMTLATLRTMNVNMTELARSFTQSATPSQTAAMSDTPAPAQAPAAPASPLFAWPLGAQGAQGAPGAARAAESAEPPRVDPVPEPAAPVTPEPVQADAEPTPTDESAAAPAMADPMGWWGALTQQFQQLATRTVQEAARQSAPAMDGMAAATARVMKAQAGVRDALATQAAATAKQAKTLREGMAAATQRAAPASAPAAKPVPAAKKAAVRKPAAKAVPAKSSPASATRKTAASSKSASKQVAAKKPAAAKKTSAAKAGASAASRRR